jgi:hypothetical protein
MAESLGLASLFCGWLALVAGEIVSSQLNKYSPTSDAHSLGIFQQELAAPKADISFRGCHSPHCFLKHAL